MGTGRCLLVAVSLACGASLAPAPALAQVRAREAAAPVTKIAAVTTGSIAGTVLDEDGSPLDGAVISALGNGTAFAVTDSEGNYALRALPPGPYLLRAHRRGYLPARQAIVDVHPSSRTTSSFTLRRDGEAGNPRIAAAGFAGTEIAPPGVVSGSNPGETAWRLRHLRRSILKDAQRAVLGPADAATPERTARADSRYGAAGGLAPPLFADLPVQGQVNLLTTGTFNDPSELLRLDRASSVAFFALGAPVGDYGEWRVRAALDQGDLSSWILSGAYVTRVPDAHTFTLGMSYGLQRYTGANPEALAAFAEGARNVGSVSAADTWTVSRRVTLAYGATYAHHDYLEGPGLFSPHLGATFTPARDWRIHASAARHLAAPGGDEFLPPSRAEFVPPQRTFSPLSRDGFRTEGVQHYDVAVERLFDNATVTVRAYHQRVGDQLVTIFGLRTPDEPASDIGHYVVGSAGDVAIDGWGVTVTHALSKYVRGSVDYSLSNAQWLRGAPPGDLQRLSAWVPAAIRPATERIHDVTTSLDADVAPTATHVLVLYKWNSAFLTAPGRDGLDMRFDVQVSQALPFLNFLRAEWEALVAVRNVLRDGMADTSVYDELLVARPPKRVVGGLTVRF